MILKNLMSKMPDWVGMCIGWVRQICHYLCKWKLDYKDWEAQG